LSSKPIYPDLRTSAVEDIGAAALAREINAAASLTEVKMAGRLRPFGNCYWNVAQVVEESGGSIVLGWLFFIWPESHYEAVHHAVWQRPNGILLDVTEKHPTDPVKSHSVFLPDHSIPVDLDIPPLVENRFGVLHARTVFDSYYDLYRMKHSAQEFVTQKLRQFGYRCEQQRAAAAGKEVVAPKMSLPQPIAAELAGYHQAINSLSGEIGKCINELRRLTTDSERRADG
jgi:hypothetical protein